MEITKKYSKLHKELQLQEYSIPFKNLDDIDNKKEFVDYVEYFQIDRNYLLEQILNCKYLKFLNEYMKDDIDNLLTFRHDCIDNVEKYRYGLIVDNRKLSHQLNDINLKYISLYIEINVLYAHFRYNITTIEPFANTLKVLYAGYHCGIDDNSLKEANILEQLFAYNNPKITTVEPFAKTLRILDACGNCGIDDKGLESAVNLQKLRSHYNPKITIKIE